MKLYVMIMTLFFASTVVAQEVVSREDEAMMTALIEKNNILQSKIFTAVNVANYVFYLGLARLVNSSFIQKTVIGLLPDYMSLPVNITLHAGLLVWLAKANALINHELAIRASTYAYYITKSDLELLRNSYQRTLQTR